MVMTLQEIDARQDEILKALGEIRDMARGTLTWQVYPKRAKRRQGAGAVGPYGLWQGTVHGERFAKRVKGAEAEHVNAGIERRHAFEVLCKEYVDLACQRALLQREAAASEEAVKKGLKSQSSRAWKPSG